MARQSKLDAPGTQVVNSPTYPISSPLSVPPFTGQIDDDVSVISAMVREMVQGITRKE